MIVSKKNVGLKKMSGFKILGLKNLIVSQVFIRPTKKLFFWSGNPFWVHKMLGPKNLMSQQIWILRNVGPRKK